MKIWVDDERPAPEGWQHVTNYNDAIAGFSALSVHPNIVSLDHDLGHTSRTGYSIALWMAENEWWPHQIVVHTYNPVGAKNICAVVNRYGPYDTECVWTPYGSERFWLAIGEQPSLS